MAPGNCNRGGRAMAGELSRTPGEELSRASPRASQRIRTDPKVRESGLTPALNLPAEEPIEDRQAFLAVEVGVADPERGGDRRGERVAVLGGEAETHDLAVPVYGHRRLRHDRLGEYPAVVAVVAPAGEDLVGRAFFGHRDAGVGFEPREHLLPGQRTGQLHVEPQ